MTTKTLDSHIEMTPGITGGKPRIAGRRITVQNIVIWHDRMGKSVEEISAEHELDLAEIHAALAYYFDHREAIDQSIDNAEVLVESLRHSTPSKLLERLQEYKKTA